MRLPPSISVFALSSVLVLEARSESFSPEQIESFEKTIRPLLVERCYDCHGAHKHENGLRLDSREAIFTAVVEEASVTIPDEPATQPKKHKLKFILHGGSRGRR
jgi:hypothetical protein